MSGTTWSRFFWSDWQSDPALRLCSYAARGLWMDMLCIAASHDPIGYVAVAGRALDSTAIARMTGGAESEVAPLLDELDRNGVFSRDRHGRVYSRRMVLDAKKAKIASQNGKKGGNPSLGKSEGNPASDNPGLKAGVGDGVKPHLPLPTIQKNPVPDGTDGEPSDDPIDRYREMPIATGGWRLALHVLMDRGGMAESKARTFLGSLKAAGLEGAGFWEIGEAAWKANTPQPLPYMKQAAERLLEQALGSGIVAPSERQQRAWAEDWRERPHQWRSHERGPRPGEPGCRVDAAILAEFGIGEAA